MLWFTLALLTAFFSATEAAVLKRYFSDLTSWEMTATPFVFLAPAFGITLFFLPTPEIQPGFWPLLLTILPINLCGLILHFRAFHHSPLSLTMPFLAITPAVVLATGYIFLGEVPAPMGAVGVIAIVVGSYVLARDPADSSILGPFKALGRDSGALCMLGAATIYGFMAVLGKSLILKSSPLFFACLFFCIFSVLILVTFRIAGKIRFAVLVSRPKKALAVAALIYAHILFHHLSISMVDAAYMMSIKRMNGIFSVFFGWWLFHETNMRARLTGAALMAAGAAFIGIWG
ncbi:MAG: DMT family transporter [Proteobacteria bacterium]|nr:DMT family transporter [Pseudomonadota bacterium]MBU1612731.1 DMT family transporter [Pseudomonadota bacterium]